MGYKSRSVEIRLANVEDAEFILSLRLDKRYNKYLSVVDKSLEVQRRWLESYKKEEAEGKQYYFIIENIEKSLPCGTVRLYDFRSSSFCWGSWILNENKTRYAALESAFLVYRFGFEVLGYSESHFDVRKENLKVIQFHKKMGAKVVGEDEDNFYFRISRDQVESAEDCFKGKLI